MREKPERFARNVLLVSFTIFLLICGSIIYGLQWFVLRSQVPMDVTLSVSRGTVRVLPPDTEEAIAVTDERRDLEIGGTISTDSTSQGLLSFRDPRTDRLVAEWVLHRDTEVVLSSALAPRFGLNTLPYRIEGISGTGDTEALLLTAINRRVEFRLTTEHGVALLSRSGHYLANVSDQQMRITTREGLAEVTIHGDETVMVDLEERAIIADESTEIAVETAERGLLENGNFRLPDMTGWAAYIEGNDPSGGAEPIIFEGRPVVLLDRPVELFEDVIFNHGEVGLEQTLDIPADDLTYLEIRATFRASEQSLSTCGIAGSECPLMIRMDYIDPEGEERAWIHGFYVNHVPDLEYPLRCDACFTDHERIAPDRWHTFESGNLMALIPDEQKPTRITGLRLYASGHAFKVYVSEMNLLGAS